MGTPTSSMSAERLPLRFGLLGYGRVAPTHVDAIRALGERAILSAVCDHDPQALACGVAATGATGFGRIEDMLTCSDIDVVSICTPSGLHPEHGIAAARAGKHVLVEKPMAVTVEAAEALIAACRDNGVKLFVVKQNRLNSTVQLVKTAMERGRFGTVYAINSVVIWHRGQDYYDSAAWRGTHAFDGGAFLNQGIHYVDAMRFLMGDVVEVKSMIGTLARRMESEDTGSALLRFKNGVLGNIFVTMLGRKDQEGSLTILAEKGTVRIGGVALNTIEQWEFDGPDPEQDALAHDATYHTASVYGNGHKAFYLQLADHMQHNGPMTTGGADGRRSLAVIRAIYGDKVHLP
jgi:UDP-N-acetyl-2-amino-2-deoxyglucuronate dehydrogenase